MATPASSATSPSPPMAYLHHVPGLQQSLQSDVSNTLELDQRKPAVDKFLARAEIAMVTRRLRAHLAYASYKATHNISHATLRDLEAQSQIQSAPSNRTVAAKRRAANYYSGGAPGLTSTGAGSQRRGGSTSMAPPASISRPHFSATTLGQSNLNDAASSQRSTGQAPNLFASILALPSMKQARTIHNPNDPPIPAPERPTQSPHASKISHRNDPARSQSKAKRSSKPKKVTTSPNKRKKKTSSVDKGKAKQRSDKMDVDGEMDMKAAATLTSLFLHHRPSVGGSTSSPRSSIDGSEIGSVHSHSHFSQSSARTSSQNAAAVPSTLLAEPSFRIQTPPPSRSQQQHTTPRAAPTDSEAADLMLYLATSPSPVRPKNKDAAAYRTLTGEKGRILFPSNSTTDRDPAERDGIATSSANLPYREPSTLTRGTENSFLSSISSISTDLGGSRTDIHGSEDTSSTAAPTAPHLSQLLPPVPLILSTPSSPARRKPSPHPRVPGSDGNGSSALEFNFHDFINASPSPSRGVSSEHAANASDASAYRPNLGLRADVGRKLFEEEQMRQAMQAVVPPPRQQERTLGASIDLVHT